VTVHLIGYEAGNLGSVLRAFARIDVEVRVAEDPSDLQGATHVLLPGVGAFASAMEVLVREGWDDAIRAHAAAGRPLLGICLGMQLLGSKGDEGGGADGLGLIPGRVRHLAAIGCTSRIPHVGWNDVAIARPHPLLIGISDRSDFYFSHSYALEPDDTNHVIGRVEHGVPVVAMVAAGPITGIQCHPEKSSAAGLRLLKNFAAI
jgi:glutamine amidotransferase